MDDVFYILLAAAGLGGAYKFWQISMDAREAANRIAKETCSRAVVQCLDGTVAFAGLRLSRDSRGRRRRLRTYTFDYTSDGFARAQGFIVPPGTAEAVGPRQPVVPPALNIISHSLRSDGSLTPSNWSAARPLGVLALTSRYRGRCGSARRPRPGTASNWCMEIALARPSHSRPGARSTRSPLLATG